MPKAKSNGKQTARKLPDGMVARHSAYYSDFGHGGRRIRKKLSTDFRVACEMLKELQLNSYRGDVGIVSNDYPMAKLLDEWLRSVSQTVRSGTTTAYRQRVARLKSHLPLGRVSALSKEAVEAYRQQRLDDGRAAATVNHEVFVLVSALIWGVDRKRIGSNPVKRLKPLKEDPKEARALAVDEVERVLAAADGPIWHNIWYALFTSGLRKGELISLVWPDIDWRSREICVRAAIAKNGKARRIPMDDKLFAIVSALYDDRENRRPGGRGARVAHPSAIATFSADHVFVTPDDARLSGSLYNRFVATCQRAGIETQTLDAKGKVIEFVGLHSTRHTFCTHMIQAGQSPKTAQELMGHLTLDMTMRVYSKVFPENKRAAVASLPYGAGIKETPDIIRIGR